MDPLQQPLGVPILALVIMLLLTYQILTNPMHIMVMTHFMLVTVILSLFFILVHQKYSHPPTPIIWWIFFMYLKFERTFYLLNNFVMTTMFILNFTLLIFLWRMSLPTLSSFQVQLTTASIHFVFHNSSPFQRFPSQHPESLPLAGTNALVILALVFSIN